MAARLAIAVSSSRRVTPGRPVLRISARVELLVSRACPLLASVASRSPNALPRLRSSSLSFGPLGSAFPLSCCSSSPAGFFCAVRGEVRWPAFFFGPFVGGRVGLVESVLAWLLGLFVPKVSLSGSCSVGAGWVRSWVVPARGCLLAPPRVGFTRARDGSLEVRVVGVTLHGFRGAVLFSPDAFRVTPLLLLLFRLFRAVSVVGAGEVCVEPRGPGLGRGCPLTFSEFRWVVGCRVVLLSPRWAFGQRVALVKPRWAFDWCVLVSSLR